MFRMNEAPSNICLAVTGLLDIFKVGAKEKKIALNFLCEDSVPLELIIDEQRIKQVLINLVQNSLKFTYEGSIAVIIKYEASENMLKITVKDTGIGIK